MTLGACGGEWAWHEGTSSEKVREGAWGTQGSFESSGTAVVSFSAISGDIVGRAYEEQGWCARELKERPHKGPAGLMGRPAPLRPGLQFGT